MLQISPVASVVSVESSPSTPLRTFRSEEYLEKTVVLYFPSLDEGYTGGETLELVQAA